MTLDAIGSFILSMPTWAFVCVMAWQIAWKGVALWMSARRRHLILFIIFLIVNLLAIPEIIYIIVIKSRESKKRKGKR